MVLVSLTTELNFMQDALPREYFPAGHVICQAGDPGDSAYLIEAGSVEVLSREGVRIAVLNAGEIFGEIALLDQLPRTATVLTLTPSTLLRIERPHVQALLQRTDPVIRHLLMLLLERFRNRSGHEQALDAHHAAAADSDAANLTLMLAQDLTHAMSNGLLELAYQPLVSLPEHTLIGFEALIRWQHPLLGSVMPTKLISLAEKTGLIRPLGLWVLQRAIADWPTLRGYCQTDTLNTAFISVNLSPGELGNPEIVESIARFLDEGAIPPHELQIELTESAVIEDLPSAKDVLQKLAATGISIALDDFGTGYASFDYLNTLPISCLKIDQSFIQEVLVSPRRREIVQTSVNLARSLGLLSIAEGIEDENTSKLLAELGCRIAQGYFYARPLSLQAIPKWLEEARLLGRISSPPDTEG